MTRENIAEMMRLREMVREQRERLADLVQVTASTQKLTGMPFGGSSNSQPTELRAIRIIQAEGKLRMLESDYLSISIAYNTWLKSLTKSSALLIIMKYEYEYTNAEIGKRMSPPISKQAVYKRLKKFWEEQG